MDYVNVDSIYYHCNAYDNNIKCLQPSIIKNGYCNLHQEYRYDFDKFWEYDKIYCKNIIGEHLYMINHGFINNQEKTIAASDMFEFMIHCPKYIFAYKRFTGIVFNKLLELHTDTFDTSYYLQQLFPYYKIKNKK
jgi:hypothetical protein